MKNYSVSHWSALMLWEAPLVQKYFRAECAADGPQHITVFNKAHYYRRKGYKVHLCTSRVPQDAIQVIHGQSVVSAEFAYLQLASKLSRQKLILLGYLLCSLPNGVWSHPLTTKKKLLSFASRAKRHYGRNKALRALKYVQDRSGSILESLSSMLLELPHRLGGCGLSGSKLNHPFALSRDGRKALGQSRCVVDAYYPQHNLVIEIDSFQHHQTAFARGKDAERATVLSMLRQRNTLTVINVQTSQIYKPIAFSHLIRRLARIMKKRLRIRCRIFADMHRQLRALLPRYDPGFEAALATGGFGN